MDKCLAVANDASSALNLDAFHAMQSLTGYPGQIGDYDQCAKVKSKFLDAPLPLSLGLLFSSLYLVIVARKYKIEDNPPPPSHFPAGAPVCVCGVGRVFVCVRVSSSHLF